MARPLFFDASFKLFSSCYLSLTLQKQIKYLYLQLASELEGTELQCLANLLREMLIEGQCQPSQCCMHPEEISFC